MPETEIKSSFQVFLVGVITVSAAYFRQISSSLCSSHLFGCLLYFASNLLFIGL